MERLMTGMSLAYITQNKDHHSSDAKKLDQRMAHKWMRPGSLIDQNNAWVKLDFMLKYMKIFNYL